MAAEQHKTPSVIIAPDKATATLQIPPGCDRALLTEQLLLGQITGAGVEVTEHTTRVIRSYIAQPPDEQDKTVSLDIAHATPPVHGIDGKVVWSDKNKETTSEEDHAEPSEKEPVSYYDQSAFLMVDSGDQIGRVVPAEPGQDGRDVTGKTIPAKSGKEFQLQIDESIMRRSDGTLIAQQDGVLYREPGKAMIRKLIQVNEFVDFSTGNIDFDGDIVIGKGVRDCFEVTATGSIEVNGMIEAATINAGKDLNAKGGFAGRERGHVFTGGCLLGKYLDNVAGHVKQDLKIDREVINCELKIDGQICSPQGSIIGGRIIPTGEVHIGTLGSDAGVLTELVVGSVPTLEPFAFKLEDIAEQLSGDVQKLKDEKETIDKNSTKGRMTAMDKERETEIIFELSVLGSMLDKAQRTLDRVRTEINKRRRVDVKVERNVFHGVKFELDGRSYRMNQTISGPVRFVMDGKAFVFKKSDGAAQPIGQVADVHAIIPGKSAA